MAHGVVTVSGDLTIDKSVVLEHGATVNAGRSLTTPDVFGSLVVNGIWSAATASSISGWLRGSGTVAGNLTVHGSGSYTNASLDQPLNLAVTDGGIAPGTPGAAGTLTIAGTLSLRDAATLFFRVGGPGATDQLRFANAADTDLDGTRLRLDAVGTGTLLGSTVALLVNTGAGSFGGTTFQGLAEGTTVQFGAWLVTLSYKGSFDPASGMASANGLGNDVVLSHIQAVPEQVPALMLAAGLAVVMLAGRRWRG